MLVPLFHCMFMGEGVVSSEGPCFTTLSRYRCCPREVRSVATWGKEVDTDLQKKGNRCTRSACKRSLWCQFLSCGVLRSKSDISRGVPCCVSSRPFTGGRRLKPRRQAQSFVGRSDQRPGVSIARPSAEHGHAYHGLFSRTAYLMTNPHD